ncbi:DUF1287 domain-containing protein [Marilutibacter alkalisoli]|uniref:DUF1287 domain-containing protein n=1 Tax=Marilutibacter alkalisoli TaxID=2591633 RepID=A0A514BWS1_9GAMM|nr:DUF1287 domain-containing protein [Lysobacter alkalisoli]
MPARMFVGSGAPSRPDAAPEPATLASAEESAPLRVHAARNQVGVTRHYDPAYVALAYPGGDVPIERGVCTDVVIRALRHEGLDLQQTVHEDMRTNFGAYPPLWGLRAPDRNIDHRRVPNLRRWFERQGWALQAGREPDGYLPGDLVTWTLPGGLPHIGIVSERRSGAGVPLVIHNVGHGTREEDALFAYTMTGHYRPRLD